MISDHAAASHFPAPGNPTAGARFAQVHPGEQVRRA